MPATDGCVGQPTYALMCMDTSSHCPHPDAIRINARHFSGGHHCPETWRKAAIWELRERATPYASVLHAYWRQAPCYSCTRPAWLPRPAPLLRRASLRPSHSADGVEAVAGVEAAAVAGAEVEAAVSVQQSASGSAQPSLAARLRRAPPSSSGRMPSAIACSAFVHTIPIAGPIWAMTAFAIPARRERISSGYLRTPAVVPGFSVCGRCAPEPASPESGGTMRSQFCTLTPSITTVDTVLLPGRFESSQSRRSEPLSQRLRFIL